MYCRDESTNIQSQAKNLMYCDVNVQRPRTWNRRVWKVQIQVVPGFVECGEVQIQVVPGVVECGEVQIQVLPGVVECGEVQIQVVPGVV